MLDAQSFLQNSLYVIKAASDVFQHSFYKV